jgi:hypothetical protein
MAVAKTGKKDSWLDGIRAFNETYGRMLRFSWRQRLWFGCIVAIVGAAVALFTPNDIAGFLVFLLGIFLMA